MLVHQGLVGVLVQHPIEENLAVSVLRTSLLKVFWTARIFLVLQGAWGRDLRL
jgi:hypothetical protein